MNIEADLELIDHFDEQILSYARLVKCAHELAGKRLGSGGKKFGNAHMKWAFSEATVLLMRQLPDAKQYVETLARKHGNGKSLAILSARLGRTVYLIFKRKEPIEANRFLNNEPRQTGTEPDVLSSRWRGSSWDSKAAAAGR